MPVEGSIESEGKKVMVGKAIDRRDFLKLSAGVVGTAAAFGLLAACGQEGDRGRLRSRPSPPSAETSAPPSPPTTGLRPLGLGGSAERDGLVYVPPAYDASQPASLALMLHGAGGDARGGISPFLHLADEAGLVLLAPESRSRTWDVLGGSSVLGGGFGPDVEFIDGALEETFDRLSVDAGRVVVAGFSDGASYALSLGLTNGDLFTHVVAFSPGFSAPAERRGKPAVFVSHGTGDDVLPIDRTSRQIVSQLEREGYEVTYREFDGPHTVPKPIAHEALNWFNEPRGATDRSEGR